MDSAGTEDIGGSIPDDPDLVRLNVVPELSSNQLECVAGDIVPIYMVVSIATKCKVLLQTIMFDFQLCAAGKIAGEQADFDLRMGMDFFQPVDHAGKNAPLRTAEFQGKLFEVIILELPQSIDCRFDVIILQKVIQYGHVGSTGGMDPFHGGRQLILVSQNRFDRLLSGAAAEQQGSIDIKQTNPHGCGQSPER